MTDIDLSVDMGNITYKNPVLPASSELASDAKTVEKSIEHEVGGIVLKSVTHIEPMRGRYVPTFYFMDHISPKYEGLMGHGQGLQPRKLERWFGKELPKIRKQCDEEELPLIGSVLGIGDMDEITNLARKCYEGGVDALEINTGCEAFLSVRFRKLLEKYGDEERDPLLYLKNVDLLQDLIKSVKENIDIPLYHKLSPVTEPLEEFVVKIDEAGIDGFSAHESFGQGVAIDVDNETQFFCSWPSGGYTAGLLFVSLARIKRIRDVLPEIYISGIGGIRDAEDFLQYLLMGCPTAQICTAAYYYGHSIFDEIVEGLEYWMDQKGYSKIDEFLGNAYNTYGAPSKNQVMEPPDESPSPYNIKVDMGTCDLCEGLLAPRCEEVCMWDVIDVDEENEEVKVNQDECWNCALCVGVCPQNAIKMVQEETGEIIWNNKGQAKPHVPKATD